MNDNLDKIASKNQTKRLVLINGLGDTEVDYILEDDNIDNAIYYLLCARNHLIEHSDFPLTALTRLEIAAAAISQAIMEVEAKTIFRT
jgi:predicted nucleic-acid-binding protein